MMKYRTTRSLTGRRGAAMVEFVMILPLLALVWSLTWFFGWELVNKEHVRMSNRWAVWRTVRGAGEPVPQQLSDNFFKDKAINVGMTTGSGPDKTLQALVTEAGKISQPAQMWTQSLVIDRFPHGFTANVTAEFPTTNTAWSRFTGAITGMHGRDGVEWRRAQARCEDALQQEFLDSLDSTLENISSPGDTLASEFRNLYRGGW